MKQLLKTKKTIFLLLICISQLFFCYLVTKKTGYTYPILFEVFLLCCLIYTSNKWNIIVLIPIIIVHSVQLASIYSTGQYVITMTLLNIRYFQDLGSHFYLLFFIVFIFIILNIFIFSCKINKIYMYIILLIFLVYTEVTYKQFPIKNFISILNETSEIFLLQYKTINKEKFEKNFIEYGSGKFNLNLDKNKNYNIIIIFMEGTSYHVLSEKLTKNLYSLSKSSINIENYYNHTATTFPGIRGQLISGYQINPGATSKVYKNLEFNDIPESIVNNIYSVESIPTILRQQGYDTIFISPHGKKNPFNNWIKTIGFERVFTRESNLSDRELYDFVYENIEKLSDDKKPFLLCIYTLGTHHGMDSPDYKYGDGTNSYLNKFYNHDKWFGKFFEKLQKNKIYENTILIVTSDHAPCPTPSYQGTFSVKNDTFIDKIPFIIHFKNVGYINIDASYRNSLSFAPTILDLLQIKLDKNYFLGDSVFTDDKSQFSHISNFVFAFYETNKNGVQVIDIYDEKYTKKIEMIMDFLKYSK